MANRIYESAIRLQATISKAFKPDVLSAASAVARLAKDSKGLTGAIALTERLAKQQHAVAVAAAKVAAGEKGAEKELKRAQAAADRTGNSLRKMGVDTRRLAEEQKRLDGALLSTERRMRLAEAANTHFGKTLEKLSERAKKYATVEGSAGKVRDAAGSLVGDAVKVAGVAVAAGAGIFALAKSTAEAGFELDVVSTKLGTTTEALQLVRSAGRKSGVEVEALDVGLGKLAINIGKVIAAKKKGGGGLSGEAGGLQILPTLGAAKTEKNDPFKVLSLSAKKLAQLAPQEQIKQIADSMRKLKTHAEKSAAAVAIFGKGGLAMLPLLEKGSAGIEELYAAARASGNILSAETIANAKKFHLAYLAAQGQITGVKNTLGAALLPAVTNVLGKFNDWLKSNRGQVKIWADQLAAWLENKAIPAVQKLIPEVMKLATQIAGWIEKGVALTGGIGNLVTVLATVRLAPLGLSVASLGVNLVRLTAQLFGAGGALAAFAVPAATIAGVAALAAAAAALGVAIGTLADYGLGISDWISGTDNESQGLTQSTSRLAQEANAKFDEVQRAGRPQAAVPRTGGGSMTISVNHAPVININGSANREDLDGAIGKGQEEFDNHWQQMQRRQARLAYGG